MVSIYSGVPWTHHRCCIGSPQYWRCFSEALELAIDLRDDKINKRYRKLLPSVFFFRKQNVKVS